MQLKKFKIRCSAIGQIMTNPRNKTDLLSKTCMTYLDSWIKEQVYGRRKEVETKYMDKGVVMEDDALDFAAKYFKYGMLLKNKEHFEDDYLTGTPDAIPKDYVIDVKCSWDCFTFPLFATEIPDRAYYWQLLGYMVLTHRKTAKLVYTLLDTPSHLIEREATWYSRNHGYGQLSQEMLDEFTKKMTYPKVKDKYKIKVFDIQYNEADVKAIQERVKECQEYINQKIKLL